MFQRGEVDYLVATDAIGMGLNMDVTHVAFAGLESSTAAATVTIAEMAQIAACGATSATVASHWPWRRFAPELSEEEDRDRGASLARSIISTGAARPRLRPVPTSSPA
jgi:hypothetical protein